MNYSQQTKGIFLLIGQVVMTFQSCSAEVLYDAREHVDIVLGYFHNRKEISI